MHGGTEKRHPMLPADEPSDAPLRRVDNGQSATVANAPDHAFGVGGHDLSVSTSELAGMANVEQRVVKSAAASLVRAHDDGGLGRLRGFPKLFQFRPRKHDAVLKEQREKSLGRC